MGASFMVDAEEIAEEIRRVASESVSEEDLRLLGYTPEESQMLDVGVLSTFIIDVISEIDPAVGPFVGESYYMRVKNGEVLLGPLKEEAIKEYKERAKQRKELIRRIWRLFDQAGEREVGAKIVEMEKELEGVLKKVKIPL